MNFEQLDRIADLFNPLLALALILAALKTIRGTPWSFLWRTGLSVAIAQQGSKWVQKHDGFGLGNHFPSTHFAVALALVVSFWLLSQRGGVAVALALVFYSILMLVQKYHTPLEMAGAFWVVPLTLIIQLWPRRARTLAN